MLPTLREAGRRRPSPSRQGLPIGATLSSVVAGAQEHDVVYDPLAPDFGTRLYEVYRTLRDEYPLYRDDRRDAWVLSRFADVEAAVNDPVTFSSEETTISQGLLPMIQQLDAPRHDLLRAQVSRAFTPRRIAEIEPRARAIAIELLEQMRAKGRGDLLRDFARHLPSRVIGEMIGVPAERIETFLEYTESFVETSTDPARQHDRSNAVAIYEEFARLLEERRANRRPDLMSALLDAEVEGRRLTQEELLGFCFVLIVAGNDTTTNLIANGSVLLARHPDQRALLAREPARIPGAVEEMLRFESPAQALPRRTTAPVTIHGQSIPSGSIVSLLWGAANHDERHFPEPERFDVSRDARRHLALGQGVHYCLGANLARLEGRVAFEELLARIPEYELTQEPGWLSSIWARAHDAVPVGF